MCVRAANGVGGSSSLTLSEETRTLLVALRTQGQRSCGGSGWSALYTHPPSHESEAHSFFFLQRVTETRDSVKI